MLTFLLADVKVLSVPDLDARPSPEDLIDAWLATFDAPNTRAAYRRDLAAFVAHLGARHLLDATADDVVAFRDAADAARLSVATRNRRVAALASFYRFVVGEGLRPDSPVVAGTQRNDASVSSTPELTEAQSRAVWRAAMRHDPRSAALVGLLLHDGLKLHEAISLRVEAVQLARDSVLVALPRRGDVQQVTLDDRTAPFARQLRGDRTEGPLFVGRGNGPDEPLTRFGADYLLKQAGLAAGLRRSLTSNQLRTTHITTARARGASLDDVRRQVGHASSRTTARYEREPGSTENDATGADRTEDRDRTGDTARGG